MREQSEIKDDIVGRDRIHVVMFFLSFVFMVLGILILVWIVKIQTTFTVDSRVIGLFRPVEQRHVDLPVRGRILDGGREHGKLNVFPVSKQGLDRGGEG